ncbi:DUF2490 domain-containing protein [Pedobacter faecalis]|uniref:DUF2490 domain-containing protein n=1 Tax=Pedobacter faecalis TaxID=3041495 RepID=UPI00254DD805|nr:DUF2490 domain-containing protein [Pedobacter sp. ELA7]
MIRSIQLTIIAALCAFSLTAVSQTVNQNSGWLFLLNSTKLNDNWGLHFDAQFRSQNEWDGVRNILIRPGLTYFINPKADVTLGYLYTPTFTKIAGAPDLTLTEHRIWEQFIYKHKISKISVSHRFRLEQRFIERNGQDDLFSQRGRYFVRFMLPLQEGAQSFTKGPFVALQNEVFLNLQNKNELNGHVYDQNRAYIAGGYRISPKLDIEAGYMNQAVNGAAANTSNHIVQLAVYTRF